MGSLDSKAIQLYDDRGRPICAQDPTLEVALGNQPGRKNRRKFGFNLTLPGTGVYETVWPPGGRVAFLSAGELMNIVSTDANDTLLGTGSRTVNVMGVDENFELIEEIVELDGLTPVSTVNKFWVVNRVVHLSAGSGHVNAGIITATAAVSASLQAHVPVGYGTTQQVFVALPVNYGNVAWSFEMTGTKLSGGAQPLITARVCLHELFNQNGMQTIVFEEAFDTAVTNRATDATISGQSVKGGQVLELTAIADTLNAGVTARFAYTQVENAQRIIS